LRFCYSKNKQIKSTDGAASYFEPIRVKKISKLRPQASNFFLFFMINYFQNLTFAGEATNLLVTLISQNIAERSEAKSAKRSFASNFMILDFFDAKLRVFSFASLSHF